MDEEKEDNVNEVEKLINAELKFLNKIERLNSTAKADKHSIL